MHIAIESEDLSLSRKYIKKQDPLDLEVFDQKLKASIAILKECEPEEGYYVAFSGGKDSQCIAELCKMAGVKHELAYALTTVDPPELVQFIKKYYPQAWANQYINYWPDGTAITMWNLIPYKRMPPTRIARYCCDILKEPGGVGRVIVTGVRWAESPNRRNKQGTVVVQTTSKKYKSKVAEIVPEAEDMGNAIRVNNDNGNLREVVEMCYRKKKTVVNPIINWTDPEVWHFLNNVAKVPHCELYDKGYTRLGCIGCPMNYRAPEELEKYPKYKEAYIRAFDRMILERDLLGENTKWSTGEEVMDWWLSQR